MKLQKNQIFILCNVVIVLLEILSIVVRLIDYEQNTFLYFTVQSNIIAMIVCAISAVEATKGRCNTTLYSWSTCLVTFTLLVMLVGASTVEGGYVAMFFQGASLLNHLVCPLLMIFAYFALLPKNLSLDGNLIAVATILAYGTTMYLLNAFHVVVGPYFFFEVYSMSLWKIIAMLLTLVAMSLLTTLTLYAIKMAERKTKPAS